MNNILATYLNKRLQQENIKSSIPKEAGPVITISREVGCNGLKFARKIAQHLNQNTAERKWKVLSKEIFQESARELDLEPEYVRRIFKTADKYTFDEILKAFNSKNYKSERVIVKSVTEIIRTFSEDGYCIIVGRAGHIIAKNITRALHIRLFAPLDYRIKTIMENNLLNREEAVKFIKKVERERVAFRKAIRDDSQDEYFFDLYINRASFNDTQTIDIIKNAMEKKQILTGSNVRMRSY